MRVINHGFRYDTALCNMSAIFILIQRQFICYKIYCFKSFYYMTLLKPGVIPKLGGACSLLQAFSQLRNVQTPTEGLKPA
jgi:hypothetical protein